MSKCIAKVIFIHTAIFDASKHILIFTKQQTAVFYWCAEFFWSFIHKQITVKLTKLISSLPDKALKNHSQLRIFTVVKNVRNID